MLVEVVYSKDKDATVCNNKKLGDPQYQNDNTVVAVQLLSASS